MAKKEKKQVHQKQLKEAEKLRDEYLAGWKRARADLLNYKKEEEARIGELIKYSNQKLILEFLPVLDDLYIAESRIPSDLKDNEWVGGLLQLKSQVLNFLKVQGVKEIESVGKEFDPKFQEAVEMVETKEHKPNTVVEEVKKGYIFHGKVIRPAQVKVSK